MPYSPFLVFGYIYNSLSNPIINAELTVITSISRKYYTTSSDGSFLFDLADAGYISGELVTIEVAEPFNNEFKIHTFNVDGFFSEQNITLELRKIADKISDIAPMTILHSVGKKPITTENPLPVQLTSNTEIDLVSNPSHSWNYTRSDGQPDSEDVTIKGITYRRTFSYNSNGFILIRSAWAKQ